jgi:hypothetical protein
MKGSWLVTMRSSWFLLCAMATLVALSIGLAFQPSLGARLCDNRMCGERISPDEAIALAMNDLVTTAQGYRPDGEARARASYPLTLDPQIGTNHVRLSDMGPDRYDSYAAYNAAVAYNSTDDEYLVVWEGDDDTGLLVDEEFEIFAQRVDAATGAEIGENDFRLSTMGPDGDPDYDARRPAVAYNSANNEYLVVWYGNDGAPLHSFESEIYGQRVDATTGAEVGADDFRLSSMGPDGNAFYSAYAPAVAYNRTANEYLVVWEGYDGISMDQGYEIYGQRLDAGDGAQVGTDDFRLSDMGPVDEPAEYHANWPAVAYNSTEDEYLVVWQGEDGVPPLVPGEWEIFCQRLDASNGDEVGIDDLRLSQAGPAGDPDYDAYRPAVAYNSTDSEYLVVWTDCDSSGGLPCGESEIHGQRVDGASGQELGDDVALSDMGPAESSLYNAHDPHVAYSRADNEYLVVWWGNDDLPQLYSLEFEIYGQRVSGASGGEVGENDFRLSAMGPDGSPDYFAMFPTVAYRSANGEYLVTWEGDDDTPPLEEGEVEIFGRRFTPGTGQYRLYLPLVRKAG